MPTDSGLRRVLSSSLSIYRTLNLREKSFTVPRSQETAAAGSVAASGLVSLRKIFLPEIPKLGAEVFHSLKLPPPGTAQLFSN